MVTQVSVMLLLVLPCIPAVAGSSHDALVINTGQSGFVVRGQDSGGYGLTLCWRSKPIWSQDNPAAVEVVDGSGHAEWLTSAYESAEASHGAIRCRAAVRSDNGTLFRLDDTYRVDRKAGAFILSRRITIENPSGNDTGFSTRFSMSADDYPRLEDFAILAPGVWYGRNESVGFLFPETEGEKTYIEGGSTSRRWAYRSHPVEIGVPRSYSLIVRLDQHANYAQAVRSTWRYFYGIYSPSVVHADRRKVYDDSIDLLARYFRFVKGAPGFPFSVKMNGEAGMYCYQMGFVGAQIGCAYHLYQSGILNGNREHRKMGEAIIDFWVNNSYNGRSGRDDLPHTWHQPVMPADAGPGPHWGQAKTERFWRDEPLNGEVFLRTLSEGHLAALNAWKLALAAFLALYDATGGRKWLDASKQAADFLETWVYVWDVPMPISDEDVAVFDRINTAGLSLVATGHSYADYADASSAHHFQRLYELTHDRHYRKAFITDCRPPTTYSQLSAICRLLRGTADG